MDVINENEKKRKRELGIDSGDEVVEPQVAAGQRPIKKAKKSKVATDSSANTEEGGKSTAERRKEKRERKKEKITAKKVKTEAKKAKKEAEKVEDPAVTQDDAEDVDVFDVGDDVDEIDVDGLAEDPASTAPSSPAGSPPFDISANHSTASSSSSLTPATDLADLVPESEAKTTSLKLAASSEPQEDGPATTTQSHGEGSTRTKQKAFTLPEVDSEKLQARLKARIEELRQKRKADGPDGQPARSRQDLLEARRKKSEARKQHKKELRAQAKADEERKNQERLQGSGSPLSADIFSPRSPMPQDNNFSFGRVAFEDGVTADAGLSGLRDPKKKKGPQDPKGALEVAKKRDERLKGFDETKRKDIEEKDTWLHAKKKAQGERVRDDTSLLKKALKRKEKGKEKGAREWKEREEGVKKGQHLRQKKREENLAKRKEEKGGKGKKAKPKPKAKAKGRPGFEGKGSRH